MEAFRMWQFLLCILVGWLMGILPFYFRKQPQKQLKIEKAVVNTTDSLEKQFENLFRYSGNERGQKSLD